MYWWPSTEESASTSSPRKWAMTPSASACVRERRLLACHSGVPTQTFKTHLGNTRHTFQVSRITVVKVFTPCIRSGGSSDGARLSAGVSMTFTITLRSFLSESPVRFRETHRGPCSVRADPSRRDSGSM
ncbi:hypothetical protein AcV5_001388 [Taiwanofungus camphoratus]|nr:hypothetical protein AcV5_001388 [Antrodia cinnamomea]